VELSQVYEGVRDGKLEIGDDDLVAKVRAAFWGTNAYDAIQMAFAVIGPACYFRPHLAPRLIDRPIEHIIALGGMAPDREDDLIAQGVAVAHMEKTYVPLLDEGRQWLLEGWPKVEHQARAEFRRQWAELLFEDWPKCWA
jgi:hypothetical protein